MAGDEIEQVLVRRLPGGEPGQIGDLARAYVTGVQDHAVARTTGTGPVPTNLSTERAELLSYVSRSLGRLPTEEEISGLLRVTLSAARSLSGTMLAVYDDLPVLALKTAFGGAEREGRGTAGAVVNGYIVVFASEEKMDTAVGELKRQHYLWETKESSGSRHVLLIDPRFPITEAVPGGSQ